MRRGWGRRGAAPAQTDGPALHEIVRAAHHWLAALTLEDRELLGGVAVTRHALWQLDQPKPVVRADETSIRMPADFPTMTKEQLAGWPARSAQDWIRRRSPRLLPPLALGVIVWLVTGSAGRP